MAAIDYLKQLGLRAQRKGSRVFVSPRARITDDIRRYVKSHRLELLAELSANDGIARKMHWEITLSGKTLCTMISEPMTNTEALEAARYRWPDAEVR